MINEAKTLLNIATTGKAQRFIQDTDAPLHDESVIAVRDKFLGASDVRRGWLPVPQRDDQRAQQDRDRGDLLDYRYVTLHARLKPETKDSINKACL